MRSKHRIGLLLSLAVALSITACANKARAPILQKSEVKPESAVVHRGGRVEQAAQPPKTYIVRSGDTLHSIAWRFGLDYRNLSRWNQISNPDLILVGQRLSLVAPPKPVPAAEQVSLHCLSGHRWPRIYALSRVVAPAAANC